MPRLKKLSGSEVIKILEKFGFQIYNQAVINQNILNQYQRNSSSKNRAS